MGPGRGGYLAADEQERTVAVIVQERIVDDARDAAGIGCAFFALGDHGRVLVGGGRVRMAGFSARGLLSERVCGPVLPSWWRRSPMDPRPARLWPPGR